jgi:hypothetical protein
MHWAKSAFSAGNRSASFDALAAIRAPGRNGGAVAARG